MGRTRLYKKDLCYNPQCINGGKPADFDNIKCWLEADNPDKVFCSPECGSSYLENIDEIEEGKRLLAKVKTKKSRKTDELAKIMYFSLKQQVDIKTLKETIRRLDLTSPWV